MKDVFNLKFVSVLMSVYSEKVDWVRKAVDSIIAQTYKNFEFIIILDNPENDFLWRELQEYARNDKRIIAVKNEKNIGLAATLNKGIEIAKGDYFVRMDADDISVPKRIEILVDFMENHSEIGVCSSWMRTFGGAFYQNRVDKYPTKHDDLEIRSLYQSPISHGAAIINRSVVNKYIPLYDTNYRKSQDYDLWVRLMKNQVKFAVISKILYLRRYSSNSGPQPIPFQLIHNHILRKNIQRELSKFKLSLQDEIDDGNILELSKLIQQINLRNDKRKLCTILLLYYFSIKINPFVRLKQFVFSGDLLKCISMVPNHLLLKIFLLTPSSVLGINKKLNRLNDSYL